MQPDNPTPPEQQIVTLADAHVVQGGEIVTLTNNARRAFFDAFALVKAAAQSGEADWDLLTEACAALDYQIELLASYGVQQTIPMMAALSEMLQGAVNQRDLAYHEIQTLQTTFEARLTRELDQCVAEAVTDRLEEAFSADSFLEERRTEWLKDRMLEEGYGFAEEEERNATEARLHSARERAEFEAEWVERGDDE